MDEMRPTEASSADVVKKASLELCIPPGRWTGESTRFFSEQRVVSKNWQANKHEDRNNPEYITGKHWET